MKLALRVLLLTLLLTLVSAAQCTFNYTLTQAEATAMVANTTNYCSNLVLTYSTVNASLVILQLEYVTPVSGSFGAFQIIPGTAPTPNNQLSGSIVSTSYYSYFRVNVLYLHGPSSSINIQVTGTPSSQGGGAAAQVAVNSTSTLSPGSRATVGNSGTSTNVLLNFGIPQGNIGPRGPQGIPGVSAGTLSYFFSDGEVPSGTINGNNTSFTLANAPYGSSLQLYKNGILLTKYIDYTLSGSAITFINSVQPSTGDAIVAYYRYATGDSYIYSFSDEETPTGTIDGMNTTFSLINSPASTPQLYRNGLLQATGVDYTVSGNTITFTSVSVPLVGDILTTWYRY